jgi:hypothetical protein
VRDAGFAIVDYDNGLQLGAMTLSETFVLERFRSRTAANGVLSMFSDGSWSMAGSLQGSNFSPSVALPDAVPLFSSVRGELSVGAFSTAQSGQQPTLELVAQARTHFLDIDRGVWLGGGMARVFDGVQWRTTLVADATAWLRRGSALFTLSGRPYQMAYGDLLADTEANVEWTHGQATWGATAGVRAGEALRGTVGWLGLSLTVPIFRGLLGTASVGSYPVDLLQGLPGGRYASFTMRLPTSRRVPVPPPLPVPPRTDREPTETLVEGMVLFWTVADRESGAEVLRLRTSGAGRVELMGDFTDWEPRQMRLTPTGVWELALPLAPGEHRFNVRIDGGAWRVPGNVTRVSDDFSGAVGAFVIP